MGEQSLEDAASAALPQSHRPRSPLSAPLGRIPIPGHEPSAPTLVAPSNPCAAVSASDPPKEEPCHASSASLLSPCWPLSPPAASAALPLNRQKAWEPARLHRPSPASPPTSGPPARVSPTASPE